MQYFQIIVTIRDCGTGFYWTFKKIKREVFEASRHLFDVEYL